MTPEERADYGAGWATGIGIGLAVFVLVWYVGARVAASLLPALAAPIVAMGVAVLAGLVVAARQGWRLSRRFLPR